jgi:hypothetical protein
MRSENAQKLKKIMDGVEGGKSIAKSAAEVGWSRQRAHRYFTRGTIVDPRLSQAITSSTSCDSPIVRSMFGKSIKDTLSNDRYGATLTHATRHLPEIVTELDSVHNKPLSRFAKFLLDNCKILKSDKHYIEYCASEDNTPWRKLAIAEFILEGKHTSHATR